MVQHLLHIQNLVTPEIWYNIRRFRRLISPLGASGSGFGIFLPPPIFDFFERCACGYRLGRVYRASSAYREDKIKIGLSGFQIRKRNI